MYMTVQSRRDLSPQSACLLLLDVTARGLAQYLPGGGRRGAPTALPRSLGSRGAVPVLRQQLRAPGANKPAVRPLTLRPGTAADRPRLLRRLPQLRGSVSHRIAQRQELLPFLGRLLGEFANFKKNWCGS